MVLNSSLRDLKKLVQGKGTIFFIIITLHCDEFYLKSFARREGETSLILTHSRPVFEDMKEPNSKLEG